MSALLQTEPQATLVTGDRRLREAVAALRPALTPAELAAQLSAEASGSAAGSALASRLPHR